MGMHDRSKGDAESRVVLPITPMLDMTFQLLFFFIVNFNPADLEGQIDMALPSEAKQAHNQKDVKPDQQPDKEALDFPADLTVEVRTQFDERSQGGISALFVRDLSGKAENVNGLEGLKAYLTQKRTTVTNKESIKIRADAKLRIRYLMQVMDVCRNADFPNVSFVPPDEAGR
jgi:biopolymer transport protein ExbD